MSRGLDLPRCYRRGAEAMVMMDERESELMHAFGAIFGKSTLISGSPRACFIFGLEGFCMLLKSIHAEGNRRRPSVI